MWYVLSNMARNQAVLPDEEQLKRLEMLRDLDRRQRRILSRIWSEIKLR